MSARVFSTARRGEDLLVRGAHIVDPLANLDARADVLVRKGVITEIGEKLQTPAGVRVIDADGWLLLPGFVDLHAHLRTPGREDEEDLASGTTAAAAGGYVAVFAMANTQPAIDSASVLEGMARQAAVDARVPVGFFAAVTLGLKGEQLTEMHELAQAGAVGFSDDGLPLPTAQLLRRALQYAKVTDRFVAIHAQDDSLMATGVMNEDAVSAKLGFAGIPAIAESAAIAQALEVARYEEGRLHLCHVSSELSLEHVARSKQLGVRVTAEATPHHLTLTSDKVECLDARVKMNPPLRTEKDRQALVAAVKDGLIDVIATDHAPHAPEEKEVPFEVAPFGTTGLETAFAALYTATVLTGELPLATLVERMSQAPARLAGIPVPTIAKEQVANFCLVDPQAEWTVDPADLHSRTRNTAWAGETLRSRVRATVATGRLVWEARD